MNFLLFQQKGKLSFNRTITIVSAVFGFLLLSVLIEQWFSYQNLQNSIGKHAYSKSYALRTLGRENQYIGKVVDVEWNSFPHHKKDIEGIQPRLLVAREVASGATETQWWCAYLFEISDHPPKKYKPSPFPKLTLLPGAR